MANGTTIKAMIAGTLLAAVAAPVAIAGGTGGCGCKTPPPPPPPPPPPCNCQPHHHMPPPNNNINVYSNASASASVNVNVNASTAAAASLNAFANEGATTSGGGGGGAASYIIPGPISVVDLNVGGESERQAYEASRTRVEKVVIQAFCFDDKDVPHPASQVSPDRDIAEAFDGEIYRCIAGSHMQITIAPFTERLSFEGGKTLTCQKGEALYHVAGQGGGRLECRPQIPARDCNERSLLRRFGAGIKVLTLVWSEKYTAYREETKEGATQTVMSFDGGVGGFVN
jgi:hypothetical protein